MPLSLVSVGSTANDGNGSPLRTAFQTVNTAITGVNNAVVVGTGTTTFKDDSGTNGVAVASNGDVTFTNAGGTAGATWDASAVSNTGGWGFGTTTPLGTLHIRTGSSGVGSPNSNADEILIEGDPGAGNGVGMSFHSPDASYTRFLFGTPTDSIAAKIEYNYNAGVPQLILATLNGAGQVILGGGGGTAAITCKASGVVNIAALPTSSAGLSTGDLWNNSGVLNVKA
jgi:hypothetical protein